MPVSNFTADDVLTAANMNLLPRGVMAYAQVTANQTGISTVVDLTSLTVTFTAVAGRRYRITGYGRVKQNTSSGFVTMTITNAANTQQSASQILMVATEVGQPMPTFIVVPGAGSVTYKLRLTTNTATCDLEAATTAPAFILVEDIGV